jgi:hypothetical protein
MVRKLCRHPGLRHTIVDGDESALTRYLAGRSPLEMPTHRPRRMVLGRIEWLRSARIGA